MACASPGDVSIVARRTASSLSVERLLPRMVLDGRFELKRRVAEGAMAGVHRALDRRTGELVAVKVLRPPDDPDHADFAASRFRMERLALERLRHPHIVGLRGHGLTPRGRPYLVMEWCDGQDLATLLRVERPTPPRFLDLMLQLLDAVAFVHDRGVLHRDLKAANVLVDDGDQIKLVDFGLARVDAAHEMAPETGRVLGSAHSISPEQVRSFDVDHRSDVYSLGVLLYRGLVGRYPFHGRQKAEILAAHLHREVPCFERLRPELQLPPALELAVRRCLAKKPSERWPDVGSLHREILRLRGEVASRPEPALRRVVEGRWMVLVALFLASLGAAYVLW